jgi:hypothetical protein
MNTARRRNMEEPTPEKQARVLRKMYGERAGEVAGMFAASAATVEVAEFWNAVREVLK